MKIGVLGTGMVGSAIATRAIEAGHDVMMGARDAGNEKARNWAAGAGPKASRGTFADAAAFGEIVFSATLGKAAVEALKAAGPGSLDGKLLVDVSNPLDFSMGMPPVLFTGPGDSLGERIQHSFPKARVVKALNTVNAQVMGHPERLGGESDLFVCGNDDDAKRRVTGLLREFGWKTIHDLGDIRASRGMEAYLLFWITVSGALKTPDFNIRIVC